MILDLVFLFTMSTSVTDFQWQSFSVSIAIRHSDSFQLNAHYSAFLHHLNHFCDNQDFKMLLNFVGKFDTFDENPEIHIPFYSCGGRIPLMRKAISSLAVAALA